MGWPIVLGIAIPIHFNILTFQNTIILQKGSNMSRACRVSESWREKMTYYSIAKYFQGDRNNSNTSIEMK